MTPGDISSTKMKIMQIAAQMFADSGYSKVTTRKIAGAVGINAASIYYHFESKEEILSSLYEYYTEQRLKYFPDIDELIKMAETEPPREVLMKSLFHYDDDIREFMDQVVVTATREIGVDPESERFIQENIFTPSIQVNRILLEYMMKLGRIEPINVNTFNSIFTYYCFSAAALNNSVFGNPPETYHSDLSFLFSLVKPIE